MYYYDSYDECRNEFINLSGSLQVENVDIEIKRINLPGRVDDDLSIDLCFIPAKTNRTNLIIISSGVHGIEGFTGSAIQRMIMKEMLPEINADNSSFLFIHSLNPFGQKHYRRFTENNIDLNRNFDIDKNLFSNKNGSYKLIYDFLNPEGKYKDKLFDNMFFYVKSFNLINKYKIGTLRQSILQGQYDYEKGIFFGGFDFEPQKALIEAYLKEKIDNHKKILLIDLHTGYGEKGKLHFFKIDNLNNGRYDELVDEIYHGYDIVGGNAELTNTGFYAATGSFAGYIYKLSMDKICIPMTYEFGTINSHKSAGQIKSIEIMIKENQCYQYGFADIKDKEKVLRDFKKLYYPADKKWRLRVMEQSKYYIPEILDRFINYKPV